MDLRASIGCSARTGTQSKGHPPVGHDRLPADQLLRSTEEQDELGYFIGMGEVALVIELDGALEAAWLYATQRERKS